MQSASKLATYDDLLALSDEVKAEVIAGQIVTQPSPLPRHGRVAAGLAREIGAPFDRDHGRGGPGGWWILPEVDVALTEHDIVRPDLAGWRRERLPDPWDTRPLTVVPDWVCEILSPSNEAYDRVTKARLYLERGVPFLWLINPAEQVLEAFGRVDEHWLRIGSYDETALARIAPFEDIELEVGLLFPPSKA